MEYDPFATNMTGAGQTDFGEYMPPRNFNYNPYEILE